MLTLSPLPFKIWPIHKQIANDVFKYIIPFVFGHGSDHNSYNFNSGTATLIDLGSGPFVLTCEHVARSFREFKHSNDKINPDLFIGGAAGINRKIIASDEYLDIATLQLTKDELNRIPLNQNKCGTQFINKIYSGPIKENDVIVFAGFPSAPTWRYKTGIKNLVAFHPCVCFAEVVSVNNDYVLCLSDHRIYESEFSHQLTLTDDPAGMSGGPAFLLREEGNNITGSFVGIISEGKFIEKNCLTSYVQLVKRLNNDGTIREMRY
jgi:hypothetical protein